MCSSDLIFKPVPSNPYPQTRTFKFSGEQYRALISKVAHLMLELEAETDTTAGECTFTFIGLDGVIQEGFSDLQTIDSFVPEFRSRVSFQLPSEP